MSGAWVTSLPDVEKDLSPAARRGLVVAALGLALLWFADPDPDLKRALPFVREAAAHVRAWRRSLPKGEQWQRVTDGEVAARTDVALLADTLRRVVDDIYPGLQLRYAEAYLRVVGSRLAAEPQPTRRGEPNTMTTTTMIPCPTCEGAMSRQTVNLVCQACGWDYARGEKPTPGARGEPGWRRLLDIIVEHVNVALPEGCDTWGIRAVHPDLRSSHGFRWPWPGGVAEAPGPVREHRGSCPQEPGDGICTATTAEGMASGGIRAHTVLLTAHATGDVVGDSEAGKLRMTRARVVEVVDLPGLGRSGHLRGADLRGADLRGADLSGANLRWANLSGANLRGADLSGANLRGADLRGADLRGANLRGADLRWADLRGADLRGADLRGADLRGADLRWADLSGADLRGADLSGADLGEWERRADGIAQRRKTPEQGSTADDGEAEPATAGRP